MAYSNRLLKGVIGYNPMGWAAVVMERAKSDKPNTPVMCEVWGFEHECGSMYYSEFTPAKNIEDWKSRVRQEGGDPDDRVFKGGLLITK